MNLGRLMESNAMTSLPPLIYPKHSVELTKCVQALSGYFLLVVIIVFVTRQLRDECGIQVLRV